MTKYIIALMLFGLALTSYADPPAGGGEEKLGCYGVSGEIDQTGNAAGLSGTITGDIEGTVVTVAGSIELHGVVFFRPAEQTWQITGGVVDALIGKTLVFDNAFMGILAQPPIMIVNTTARIAEGAQKANITLHGWTDLSGMPTLAINHFDYHGVICP